ncbi:MAG: cupredoxin domain-containing protein [Candidatus Taylorbacteria bacterium]|nr:cupredoxin domain-containing protein [Candidatus Taylorbacteria bacterium]
MFRFLLIIIFALFSAVNSLAHNPEGFSIIHMTETGFEPLETEVKEGDIVIFENMSKNNHWPASNIHPTHGIYPEFDSKKPVPPDTSWEFKFIKAGKWKYHDHLNPKITGTVIVNITERSVEPSDQQPEALIKKLFNLISSLVDRFKNYLFKNSGQSVAINLDGLNINEIANNPEKLAQYLKMEGIKKAMTKLIEESGGGSTFDCHQQAHNIGRVGYNTTGEEAFRECTASCHSGCYHGAMESFLNKIEATDIAHNVKRICQTFETNFGIFECLHGVGHGVLAYTNYDLPEAIKECEKLGDSFSTSSCYGGLFMENILTGQGLGASKNDHETSWLKEDDPYFPCNAIGDDRELLYQCYQMQTSWMLTIANYDFKRVAGYCLKAPVDMVSVCMKSYGRDAAGHTLRNPEKIIELCNNPPDKNNYRNDCLIGAVNVIVDFWGHELKDQASELCRLAMQTNKKSCYDSLIGRLEGLFKERRQKLEICETMESSHKEQCLSTYGQGAN